jgi:AMMECR1 domain-containing protein
VRAGIDGLVLSADGERVTFLPSVWEQLPEPEQFLRHLKLKAGWLAEAWPANLRVWRYTTEEFGKSH